jgi:hypothetical protein
MTDNPDAMMLEPAARGLDLYGNPLPRHEKAIKKPRGHVPLRRPGSIRRTMSIDIEWPGGLLDPSRFLGRARDIFTPVEGGDPVVLAEDVATGRLEGRVILDVESRPHRETMASLAGERAGAKLRGALDRVLHGDKVAGAPIYLLLDDLAGASLVCAWGWSRWYPDELRQLSESHNRTIMDMEGVCIGFRPGSRALTPLKDRAEGFDSNSTPVLPLVNPEDPAGWHELPAAEDRPHFRRARMIDIWREDGRIHVESMFQDSASEPGSALRQAIHEYSLRATADIATGTLLTLEVKPGTLPHAECPAALSNVGVLVNTPMADLRDTVLERLRKTAGCTHLNDMMRSLAEVPVLAGKLPG